MTFLRREKGGWRTSRAKSMHSLERDPSAKCIAKMYLPKRFQPLATITRTARSHQFRLVMDKPRALHLFYYLIPFSVISSYIFQSKENYSYISWIESLLDLRVILRLNEYACVLTLKEIAQWYEFPWFSNLFESNCEHQWNYIFQNKENYHCIFWIELPLNVDNFKVMWIHVRIYFERNCTIWINLLLNVDNFKVIWIHVCIYFERNYTMMWIQFYFY